MQPEIRFILFEYISSASERHHDCLRVNFDFADATLKARLKAFGMRWPREVKYFYFIVPEGFTDQKWGDELKSKLDEAPSEGDETGNPPGHWMISRVDPSLIIIKFVK